MVGDRNAASYTVLPTARLYVWASGEKFEGFWHHGAQTGRGTYIFASGDVFKGKWEMAKKSGVAFC